MYELIIVIFLAYVVDIIIGDPYGFPHPVIYIGRLISKLEKVIRKSNFFSKTRIRMKLGGLVIWATVVLITGLITYLITFIFDEYNIVDILLSIFILWTCFSTKCLADEAKKVYFALKSGGDRDDVLEKSRKQLSNIVGRDTENLSEKEIIRATVETVAENTVDGTISPMMYSFIGGPVFAMIFKAVNTMDSMLGYKNEKYIDIGMFPARLDDVFNYIPARMSLFFFTVASAILRYDYISCFKIGFRDRKNHKSPNCAYSEGAVAGALGIQLGGTNMYFGKEVYKPTIGDKKREVDVEDIEKSIKLMYVSTFVALIIFTSIYYVIRVIVGI